MGFLTSADPEKQSEPLSINEQALRDLMLRDYLDDLFGISETARTIDWTRFLTTSPDDLVYRREVLTELVQNPDLVEDITAVCKCLSQISNAKNHPASDEFLSEKIRDFSLLALAHTTMQKLSATLNSLYEKGSLTSHGLQRLRDVINEKLASNFTADFEKRWADVAGGIDQPSSLRLRFTMDGQLHTQSAAITHIQRERFVKPGLFQHTIKEDRQPDKPWDLEPVRGMQTPAEELVKVELSGCQKEFLSELTRITTDLNDLYTDLVFYLGALRYRRQMHKAGVPLCYAAIMPRESRSFRAQHMIDPVLAMAKQGKVVPNSIDFQDHGEILILTGINQGGKTTFLRTVGTIQVLFQLGWPVPAKAASISPADQLITVFSHEENTNLQHGKLGQELKTIRAGLDQLTRYSLALFNEPITGTSPMENLYLSREVLSAVKIQGCRGIWVTHIYDLASGASVMNRELPGSTISSIRAIVTEQTGQIAASFRIERGEPQFTSYAKEVLQKETGIF